MDPEATWQIIVLLILLLSSAFFSASETALMTLSRIRIRHMVEEEIPGADQVNRLIENSGKLLGAILVGNNLVNIGASALATAIMIQFFGDTGIGIATVGMTILVLIIGEITPKTLAAQYSESVALKVSRPLAVIIRILSPITAVMVSITNVIIQMFGGKVNNRQPFITEEELRTMVHVGHEEGVLEGEEKKMIYNVFEFGDSRVKDVMTPRTDMVAIEVSSTYEEIIDLFKEEQFSRIPVYEDTPDNVVGILTVKDLIIFSYQGSEAQFDIYQYLREAYFTYEFKPVTELLKEMRHKRLGLAIVLDEYGGTAGIITMEDLVEEIVGEIRDEYDGHERDIEVVRENEYILDGSTRIDEVNEMIGTHLESDDFDSIGGYVLGLFGRLPEMREAIEDDGITFIVEEVDKNRIESLRIIM